jgi:hypothetical protein
MNQLLTEVLCSHSFTYPLQLLAQKRLFQVPQLSLAHYNLFPLHPFAVPPYYTTDVSPSSQYPPEPHSFILNCINLKPCTLRYYCARGFQFLSIFYTLSLSLSQLLFWTVSTFICSFLSVQYWDPILLISFKISIHTHFLLCPLLTYFTYTLFHNFNNFNNCRSNVYIYSFSFTYHFIVFFSY